MDQFSAERGTVTFHQVKGIVLSGETGTKVDVSLSGGGGHVGPNGGYVSAPQLRTASTDVQSLWIRTDEGRDDHFSLVGTTAAVTGGQHVVMVLGEASTSKTYWPVVLININSQRYHPLAGIESLARRIIKPSNDIGPWGFGFLSFFIGAFLMINFDRYSPWHGFGLVPMLFGPGICFAWWVASRFLSMSRFEATRDRLAAHVDVLGRTVLTIAAKR